MCGIAGIAGPRSGLGEPVEAMVRQMRARGPDAQDLWSAPGVCLGHSRLKIIDISDAGNQPMRNEDGSVHLVFNGEIYNFRELRAELAGAGHVFASASDTEVILHGYEQWGPGVAQRLRGMFAYALWDSRLSRLVLARDRLGIKPLYYCCKDGALLFASQVRALLASGLVSRELCVEAVQSYLGWGGVCDPDTLLREVKSLLPGHTAVFGEHGLRTEAYWHLPTGEHAPRISRGEAAERVRPMLLDAVGSHLVSDVPLGVFLSGGMDSAALVACARARSSRVVTVTLGFDDPRLDERQYARTISQRYGTEHREQVISWEQAARMLPAACDAMDQPTFDGVNTYFVSKAAKDAGLTVALSGLGGDELFCGYEGFSRIRSLRRLLAGWHRLPEGMRRSLLPLCLLAVQPYQRDKVRALLSRPPDFTGTYEWMRQLFTFAQREMLLGQPAEVTPEVRGEDPGDMLNAYSVLELAGYLRNILLRDTDALSMAHSLEVRVPFLDHVLVEGMLGVPGEVKVSAGVRKPLLAESLPDPLPQEVRAKAKTGFLLPFDAWMRGPCRAEIEQELSAGGYPCADIMDGNAVRHIWRGFLSGKISWQRPWSLYVLKRWMRNNL